MGSEGIGQFVTGLILGIVVGLILGPILRFWLSWREWVDASREARLTEDVLKRMDRPPWRSPAHGPPARADGFAG